MRVARTLTGRPRPMSALEAMAGGPWLFAAVALCGLGLAGLQATATRLLAVLYPTGVVVAISVVALSGLGVGAAIAHGLGRRVQPAGLPTAGAMFAAGVTALLALLTPFVRSELPAAAATLLLALPMGGVGLALAAAFAAVDRRTGRLVGVWLAATALGLPVALGLLAILPPPDALPLIAAVLAGAAMCAALATGIGQRTAIGLLTACALLALTGLALPWPTLAPDQIGPPGDGLSATLRGAGDATRIAQSRWDGDGRLDIVATGGERRAFVDGAAVTEADAVDIAALAPPPRERALSIVPRGAAGVALTILGGAAPRLGPLGVATLVTAGGDGRSSLREQGVGYDLIWLGRPGRPALHPAGLAEGGASDLTVEALDDYLRYLAPGGVLVLRLPDEPSLARAALTAVAALERRGVPTVQAVRSLLATSRPAHLLAVRLGAYGVEEGRAVQERLVAAGWTPLFTPHALETGPLGELVDGQPLRRVAGGLRGVTLVPPIDASPFFDIMERDLPTPIWLTLVATLLILLIVLGYLAWTIEPDHYSIWRAVPFAAAAGAGGALLSLALAQRLTIWLESYWLAALVVTAALGGWAAVGAAASDRLTVRQLASAGMWASLLIAVWCALEAFGLLLPVDRLTLPPLAGRVAIIAVLLAPPGVALGLPLPVLLRAGQRYYAGRPVALLWSVNGVAAALGAAAFLALALRLGLTANLLLTAALFAGLALLARPALAR